MTSPGATLPAAVRIEARRSLTRTIVRLFALAVLLPALAPAEPGSPANIEIQKLAEGVHAVLRTDPPGVMFEANSAFLVGADDVVVIDGGSNPTSARELQPLAPTLTFDDYLTLVRGGRTIDLLWLGRAHTRGDIVIHLPKEGIVFTGDLVAGPDVIRAYQQATDRK